mmetsp:Transcript_100379/g.283154  ORF Transcript_100379/g.283154 Transcript_100379/m.283154 type:complete len:397 (+) Transcript_100379:117-1307(+)
MAVRKSALPDQHVGVVVCRLRHGLRRSHGDGEQGRAMTRNDGLLLIDAHWGLQGVWDGESVVHLWGLARKHLKFERRLRLLLVVPYVLHGKLLYQLLHFWIIFANLLFGGDRGISGVVPAQRHAQKTPRVGDVAYLALRVHFPTDLHRNGRIVADLELSRGVLLCRRDRPAQKSWGIKHQVQPGLLVRKVQRVPLRREPDWNAVVSAFRVTGQLARANDQFVLHLARQIAETCQGDLSYAEGQQPIADGRALHGPALAILQGYAALLLRLLLLRVLRAYFALKWHLLVRVVQKQPPFGKRVLLRRSASRPGGEFRDASFRLGHGTFTNVRRHRRDVAPRAKDFCVRNLCALRCGLRLVAESLSLQSLHGLFLSLGACRDLVHPRCRVEQGTNLAAF